ncbi:type VI secretion protein [Pandoraea horticolens]|uniref:Type VI secretion protein n=1 Tax=Pandoraea horticolens TaxID=2508298 RepID=A0A5E4YTJ1_9BURK|nr:type VI secretion system baseplate subunit TssG [Pandoraea horticolens]VVE52116.1 type VI secretion protein [Pandoraea horticolens]
MATEDRPAAPALSGVPASAQEALRSFIMSEGAHRTPLAFFQALRLMRAAFADDDAFRASVRVQPNLSLAFPSEDVAHIAHDDSNGIWRVVANFFGLYGVSSPLPTFYTEDLINERRNGRTTTRDFLDVLHAAIYPMLFSAWEKYRIWIACAEWDGTRGSDYLFALIGQMRGDTATPVNPRLLHFAGLFSQFPRSALGLETLVRGLLGEAPVSVTPCVTRRVPVPQENRCALGQSSACIGETLIGQDATHCNGTAEIRIGPVHARCFETLLPGGEAYAMLSRDIALYLHDPIHCELAVLLDPLECEPATLGGRRWGRLGLDTWLAGQRQDTDVFVARFALPLGECEPCPALGDIHVAS